MAGHEWMRKAGCAALICAITVSSYATDFSKLSGWQLSESTSPMDDTKTIIISMMAEQSIHATAGAKHHPELLIRCRPPRTEVYVTTGQPLEAEYGGGSTLRLRFDDRKPVTVQGSESTSLSSVFLPRPIALARQMMRSQSLLVELTPYRGTRTVIQFDLRGLEHAIKPVRAACRW